MNFSSQIRHFLTFLAGIGTMFVGWHLIAPDQVAAVNAAGAQLIDPLMVILGAVAVCLCRALLSWAGKFFERIGDKSSGGAPGGAALLIACGTMAVLMGGLPSCSAVFPVRIGLKGPDGAVSYSSKGGIKAKLPSGKIKIKMARPALVQAEK